MQACPEKCSEGWRFWACSVRIFDDIVSPQRLKTLVLSGSGSKARSAGTARIKASESGTV